MRNFFVKFISLHKTRIWDNFKQGRNLISFSLEITARCNNNCRHCYVALSENNSFAKRKELTLKQIENIANQAVELGALGCLITGGEPLLRKDFFDIYLVLKKRGLLVSVFTNATLIKEEHIIFFRKYPPSDIEVTVYGITKETYERVTRRAGSFAEFMKGVELLLTNKIKVRFKTVVLRSNVNELTEIGRFCRKHSKDYFRFDPFLHLRFDHNPKKNNQINLERLTPREIVAIEQKDFERRQALEKDCQKLINPEFVNFNCNHLFHCGAGNTSFYVSYDGFFRLCSSLCHPSCIYDLNKGSLLDAWYNFVSKVKNMRSYNKEFILKCRKCELINLCMWCPAHAYLETGKIDGSVGYFCAVAHARADSLIHV